MHFGATHGKPLPAAGLEPFRLSTLEAERAHHAGAFGLLGLAVRVQAGEGVEFREVEEIARREFVAEFSGEDLGVAVAHAEGYEAADVAEDGLADGERELIDILMAEGEAEAVFAGLGEDAGEGIGAEVLEFVDVHEEVSAVGLGNGRPGHGGELELGDEQGAEEIGFVGSHAAFGEVGDENAGVVHDEWDADPVAHLPEDVANDGGGEQGTDFVLNRGDGFAHKTGIVASEFLFPELADEGVSDLLDDPTTIVGINEHPVHAEQGSVLAVEQSGDTVIEYVLHTRPPRVAPDGFERLDDAGGDEGSFIWRDIGEGIEANGKLSIGRIEIDEVIRPVWRDVVQKLFGQIAMRINDGHAMPPVDVLDEEVAQQSGFPRSRDSDDVAVMPGILRMDAKGDFATPREAVADHDGFG